MALPIQPISVLAQACRFPGADSPDAFWRNLANGVESIGEVPTARWSVDTLFTPPPYQPGKSVAKWGAFLADIQRFDAAFFNIPAAEAQVMDPQQRILLELAYETLERAGYDAERRKGLRIGVFLGIGQNGYSELTVPLLLSGQPTHPMLVANNIRNLVAGQIAHSLNLTGPALVVDTACSSSLVALHIARHSLLAGECDLALVGGINLNITATPFVAFSSAGVLAPSPHTYVFDERANGFVLGEGGGMLLVSTLAHANANQDPILGLLCGSAINNDGHSLGTMTPSPAGQEAVLRAAYTAAAIPPETISYIEAHATGTRIGDVVEARALTRCFPQPPAHGVRYLGGVKPNVGHLLSAAAMPSLLKVLLALQHRQLPPTLHCEQVRPIFKLDQAGLTLNRSLVDWTPAAPGLPLRAGVSSFGFGGTNAHVILEEAPPLVPRAKGSAPYAFARTPYWIEKLEDRGRRTEDGEQKTDGRGRRTDGLIGATVQSIPLPPIEPAVDGWLQRVGWEAAQLWHRPVAQRCCGWRLLATATPSAQRLAERLSVHLQAQGVPCSEPGYLPDDEVALDEWLAAEAPGWGLVFVGAVGAVEPLNEQAALAAGLDVGLFRFQQVAQRLVRLPATQQPAGLWLVTAGAHGIEHDDEAIAPERAALAGLAFALNDELPTTPCCVVDLAPSAATDLQVAQVAAELGAEPTRAVIAWRQQQGRWTRRTRHLAPLRPTSPTPPSATLRKGVYLITGGASGIGAALARSLADLGMTLVLTGRTPLTRAPQRAALVMALRKRGVTVEYIVADITQASEVATLLEYICQLYGPPVGVIHAAGIVRPQPLRSKSQADMAAVLAPKVIGAWLLAQELERRAIQPTCFVLFSSIAALLPGFGGGVSDYVAANAFLDALAATERRRGVNCTVINWSIWAETGMAAQPALLHHWAAQGLAGLTSAEGISAFYRALSLAERQVVVCKPQASATTLARQSNAPRPPFTWEKTVDTATSPALALTSEVAPVAYSAIGAAASAPVQTFLVTTRKIQAIEETLQQLLATVLKVAPADVSKSASFMNLGIDSMDALDLVQKLEAVGFRGLPATLFFEYQTIADLAHYLSQQPTRPEPQTPAAASPTHTDTPPAATYPLTPIQRAFAISHILYPARPAVAFLRQTVQGVLQLDRLQQAVNQIAARHPLLRTRFTLSHATADTLTPIICPPDDPTITPLIETITEQTGVDGLATLEARLINRPFDLAAGSPWRIMAVADQQQPAQWHLLLALHHIVGDAWSLSLVAHELWALYTALTQGRTLDLPTPPCPWQASPVQPEPEAAALAWWRQQLAHDAPALPLRLPFDHDPTWLTPDEWDTTQYTAHATPLTPVQSAALTQLAADHQLSLFHLVLALYLRALQQWSAATELVINVADAQRPPHLPGIMDMVGSFADTLPLWLTIDPAEPVLGLAERVRQQWLLRQPHKRVSSVDLARLLAEVAPTTHATQLRQLSPLGFSFARFDANPPADCPVNIVEIFGRTATPTMRLSLVGWEFAGALHFSWNYVTPLFQPATIEALAAHFSHEIDHLLGANRSQDVSLSLGKRKANVLTRDHQAGEFVAVPVLVQAQAQRTPHAIAVWANGAALTYAELDDRSSQVAAALGDLNEKCAPVGLLAQPSTAAVELLLGIAKAGAAWVPLDPAHPPLRHADQLGQAGVQILVFPADLAAAAAAIQVEMAGAIQLYSLDDRLNRREDFRLSHLPKTKVLTTDQIAYIIFTSGSTGRPKGVPITHGALANYIGWAVDTFGYSPTDRVMQATSLCFDASIRQILAPLVTGGTVVPVAGRLLADPQALLHFIQENQITIWSSVPALWGRLLSALESNLATGKGTPDWSNLRWIQVGGEALPAQLVRRWFDLVGDRQQIANLYGPTETTINATCYIVPGRPAEAETQIPIGYPVRGAQLLVCDEAGQPCPAGAIGELWIGGVGLSPGYLEDAQRTQERFVTMQAAQRFYRSGDRVQQGADGALRFLGRLDEQVKVRGYRIELGEIEALLSQHPAVRLAAVIARQGNDDERQLIAYLECTDAPPEEQVRQWLQERLPAYMLPHQIYLVARLPQMPNGKIDRQSLISGATIARSLPRADKRTAPQTATEQKLAALWATVLHRSTEQASIAREDDFFALGGDSLQAIRLFVELEKTGAAVPRATYLYRYRTLAALAQALDEYQPASDAAATIPMGTGAATEEQFGVSLAQAGFLLARALHNNEATSWCARFWLTGPLQVAHFQEAVQMLVERHAMLRAVFPPSEGRSTRAPQQRIIQPARPLPVHFVDWQALNAAEQQSAIAARWEAVHSRQFDPAQWPLIEMHLCRLTPTDHLWFVATDHLIGDGLSGWLLGQELLQLYDALVQGQAPTLPPLRSIFRDYVTVQQRYEQQPDPAAEAHWRQVFATPYHPPKRHAAESANAGGWVHQSVDLTIADVEQMERYAADLGVTPYELLLTLFFRQLQRLTHQADLVVGSAIAGRDEPLPDIMKIFGAFAMSLPIRVHLVEEGWAAQVQGVAQTFQAARAHTLSPRRIAQLMHPQTPLTAALGAQFLFSYMDFTALGPLHSDTLQMRWEASQTELQPPTLAADLVLTGRKVAGQLRLLFTAPAAAMTAAQMATSVDTFVQELVGYSQQQGVTSRKDFSLSPTQRKTKVFPATASPLQFTDQPLESNQVSAHARPGVDAALLGYLPPFTQIQRLLGAQGMHLEANDLRQLLFPEQQPCWLEQLVTPLGQSGLIAIPRFADELATLHPDQLAAEIKQAMRYAATLGARCVSLAGMLPAHTRYGYRLLAEGQNANQPALTTGHSTTVVAVVKTIQAVLAATGQALSTVALGCLGVGSIGSAALQLLLNMVGHPATITLCDVAGSADRLAALAATLSREFDYQGNVRIIEGSDQLPTELYQLDLLVGATSRPNVLEVARLAPGTIVVDDSFPPCFAVEQAIERMRTAQDVLLVGGGLLQCGTVARTIHLPVAHPALRNVIAGQLHAAAIASCQLEALLWAARPGLPLTHGIATLPQAVPYWAAAEAMGITAAPLHLRDFPIADPLLQQIKARIAQRRQAPVQ